MAAYRRFYYATALHARLVGLRRPNPSRPPAHELALGDSRRGGTALPGVILVGHRRFTPAVPGGASRWSCVAYKVAHRARGRVRTRGGGNEAPADFPRR